MKLSLREASQISRFRDVVALMKTINEEQTLNFTPEGITSKTMDPSHIAMLLLNLKAGNFEEYVPDDEELLITLNLTELSSRLATIDAKKESVTFEHDKERAKLNLHIRDGTTSRKRRFGITILEPLDAEVPDPKIQFKATGRVLFPDWERAVKDAELVSEHIQLAIVPDENNLESKVPQIHFQASGDLGDSFLAAETLGGNVEKDEDVSSTFTLSYLSDMTKAIKPLADVVEISMSKDMPVKISLEGNTNLEATLFLAPCIGV